MQEKLDGKNVMATGHEVRPSSDRLVDGSAMLRCVKLNPRLGSRYLECFSGALSLLTVG